MTQQARHVTIKVPDMPADAAGASRPQLLRNAATRLRNPMGNTLSGVERDVLATLADRTAAMLTEEPRGVLAPQWVTLMRQQNGDGHLEWNHPRMAATGRWHGRDALRAIDLWQHELTQEVTRPIRAQLDALRENVIELEEHLNDADEKTGELTDALARIAEVVGAPAGASPAQIVHAVKDRREKDKTLRIGARDLTRADAANTARVRLGRQFAQALNLPADTATGDVLAAAALVQTAREVAEQVAATEATAREQAEAANGQLNRVLYGTPNDARALLHPIARALDVSQPFSANGLAEGVRRLTAQRDTARIERDRASATAAKYLDDLKAIAVAFGHAPGVKWDEVRVTAECTARELLEARAARTAAAVTEDRVAIAAAAERRRVLQEVAAALDLVGPQFRTLPQVRDRARSLVSDLAASRNREQEHSVGAVLAAEKRAERLDQTIIADRRAVMAALGVPQLPHHRYSSAEVETHARYTKRELDRVGGELTLSTRRACDAELRFAATKTALTTKRDAAVRHSEEADQRAQAAEKRADDAHALIKRLGLDKSVKATRDKIARNAFVIDGHLHRVPAQQDDLEAMRALLRQNAALVLCVADEADAKAEQDAASAQIMYGVDWARPYADGGIIQTPKRSTVLHLTAPKTSHAPANFPCYLCARRREGIGVL